MAKYNFKDAFKILKVVADTATDLYKSKSDIIVRQLENTTDEDFGRSEYGLFSLKNNAEKTIKEYTEEEKAEFDKLQQQIDELKAQQDALGTDKVVKEAYKSLVYYKDKNGNAQREANELLADLVNAIGNATMIKASQSKIKVAKK